ncbi:putative ribosome-binding factor A [Nymphaea thermarum]|nr:putative ribosome-binding factor A [Nymphaea thermarum]
MATLLQHTVSIPRPHHPRGPAPSSSTSSSSFSLFSTPLRHDAAGNRRARSYATLGPAAIVCMAKPRRVKMVAKQIQRELSQMLLTDKVLQYAVLPESALGADRYLSSLTTISDVEVSGDLQVVKVYVSVFGDERGREVAIAGLKSKAKYVRSELGRRMKLRVTPEIRFIEDESMERGSRVIAILDRLKEEREKNMPTPEEDNAERVTSQDELDDKDWDEDDTDDGIIYVK